MLVYGTCSDEEVVVDKRYVDFFFQRQEMIVYQEILPTKWIVEMRERPLLYTVLPPARAESSIRRSYKQKSFFGAPLQGTYDQV